MEHPNEIVNPEAVHGIDKTDNQVPTRGLIITFLALFTTCFVYVFRPEYFDRYIGLVWIFGLIPIFLLSYYRGWKGSALAAVSTMIAFAVAESVSFIFLDNKLDWWLYGIIVILLLFISLFTGWLSNRLIRERREAMKMAFEDALTRLASRRALDFFFNKQVEAAQRGKNFSIAFFDLDDFKLFNDKHGHDAGDQVLERVGQVFNNNTREGDITGRFGGEEFLSVLPGEGEKGAKRFAERVCAQIAKLDMPYSDVPTMSAGVASWEEDVNDKQQLLNRADKALYRAKAEGGNLVKTWTDIDESDVPETE